VVLQAEELRHAVLEALEEKSDVRGNRFRDSRLRATAEAIQYEDWAVDFNLVCLWFYANCTDLCSGLNISK